MRLCALSRLLLPMARVLSILLLCSLSRARSFNSLALAKLCWSSVSGLCCLSVLLLSSRILSILATLSAVRVCVVECGAVMAPLLKVSAASVLRVTGLSSTRSLVTWILVVVGLRADGSNLGVEILGMETDNCSGLYMEGWGGGEEGW